MVGTSNFRDRYRSNALKQLARERAEKRTLRVEEDEASDSDDSLDRGRVAKRSRSHGDSLLSILPEPTNSKSAPGYDWLAELIEEQKTDTTSRLGDEHEPPVPDEPSDMIEINVSKLVNDTPLETHIARTKTTTTDTIKMPKSKEKEKNHITYLAKLAKAAEPMIQERASQGRANKTAARNKYAF